MKIKKEILLLAVSLALSLVIIELGLRKFTNFPIHGINNNRIPHPVLGHTLDPSALPDVDADGFRNPRNKGRFQIVAIGDSQTQGYNVERQDAWPYQLGKRLNKSVYNYGVGGYGIFHYLYLAKEAVSHAPEHVLLGLYPTNDIGPDTCGSVSRDYYQKLLKSGIAHANCSGKPEISGATLAQYSALLSALEHLRFTHLKPVIARIFYSEEYFYVGSMAISKRQVFKHNGKTDLSRERVKANFDASKTILSLMRNELLANGIKFGVLVIPSKELVIERWAIKNGVDIPSALSVEPEKNLIDNYLAFLKEQGIAAVDATPFVVDAFEKSAPLKEDFYPFEDDHPYAEGYASYSLAAEELISILDENGIKADRQSSNYF